MVSGYRKFFWSALVSLLVVQNLLSQPVCAYAQQPQQQPAQPEQLQQQPAQPQQPQQQQAQQQQQQEAQQDKLIGKRAGMKIKSVADLKKTNEIGWQIVDSICASDPSGTKCAQASVAEVNLECTESSKFFKKGSNTWTWINFGLIISSSVFTGLGASTTLANAKVFSTLGGSTALGSVATTATTNSNTDQGGLLAINSTLDSFLKFIQTGAKDGGPADADLIYISAPIYAAKCTSAASSTGH
jgi:hypothetical protein